MSSARNATRIIGPIVAGILVAGAGSGRAIAVDAATYALAALCLLRLNVSSAPKAARTPLVGGLSYFRSVRWLWPVSLAFFAVNLVQTGPWQILGLRITGPPGGARDWGLVLSARAVGLLIMSVLIYRLAVRHHLRVVLLASTVSATPLLGLGVGLHGNGLIVAPSSAEPAHRHRRSPATAHCRNTSSRTNSPGSPLSRGLFSYAAIPIGQLAAGPLASQLGPANVCLTAALLWITAVLTPLGNRAVRSLTTQRPTSTDDTPAGDCSH